MVRVDESVRVVIPRGMRFQIFALAHSHPMAGHLGERRTWARIGDTYTWFRSRKDVVLMVKSCLVCGKNSTKTVPVEGVPPSQWAMDDLGPLPKSEDGNQYVLVVTDMVWRILCHGVFRRSIADGDVLEFLVPPVLGGFGFINPNPNPRRTYAFESERIHESKSESGWIWIRIRITLESDLDSKCSNPAGFMNGFSTLRWLPVGEFFLESI